MNHIIRILTLCFFVWPAIAGGEQMQSEIDHLIQYVQDSSCTFIRNGKAHSPEEAVAHILKKYDHFKARIKTAEDFIDYCATKSLLSNQPYQIGCPDQAVVESGYWFLQELKRFRNR